MRSVILGKAEGTVLAALAGNPAEPAQGFDAMARAESHAQALRQCAGVAEALGLQDSVARTLSGLAGAVEAAAEKLQVDSPGDASMRRAQLVHAIRLLEILSNPNRADQLRIKVDQAPG